MYSAPERDGSQKGNFEIIGYHKYIDRNPHFSFNVLKLLFGCFPLPYLLLPVCKAVCNPLTGGGWQCELRKFGAIEL